MKHKIHKGLIEKCEFVRGGGEQWLVKSNKKYSLLIILIITSVHVRAKFIHVFLLSNYFFKNTCSLCNDLLHAIQHS